MACSAGEKTLDKVKLAPYATPSMRGPLSPEMLTRGTTVQIWTERGDPLNAGQEEGCQEGDQEEEVGAPGKGGVDRFTLPTHPPEGRQPRLRGLFCGLTALIAESSVPNV